MSKITPKDIRAGLFIVVLSLFILGAMHLVPQPKEAIANISPQLRKEVITHINAVSAVDLRKKLKLNQGKQTLLVIYTSWCPYCQKAIPSIINWKQQGLLDNMQLIMLSIDEDPEKIINYLGTNGYHKQYTPYVFQPQTSNGMSSLVKDFNMNFNGGIPYGAVFNSKGTVIAESTSGNGWDDINQLISGDRY